MALQFGYGTRSQLCGFAEVYHSKNESFLAPHRLQPVRKSHRW